MNKLPLFFMKMTITHARKVQIAKFWCLKSSTNIWLSCGNIYSISKINKIEIEARKGSKTAKNGQFLLVFNLSFPLLFEIEKMFPQDSQILVADFGHQNFAIWTFLA